MNVIRSRSHVILSRVLTFVLCVLCLVQCSGADYYDYGHGLSEETYDSYGECVAGVSRERTSEVLVGTPVS